MDVDAGLHCESQQFVSELLLAGDAPSDGCAAPVFDDRVNEKGGTATKIDIDAYESVVDFRNQRRAIINRDFAARVFQRSDGI